MRSDREWIWWQRGETAAWTETEFLASGKDYFHNVAAHWRQYGMGTRHVVEIGCGAGRITKQLLSVFARVTAISPGQIALDDAERVRFSIPQGAVVIPPGTYNGRFSREVFRQFSSFSGIASYCRATLDHLVPGGTVCFQLPLRGIQRFNPVSYAALRIARVPKRALGGRRMMEYRMYSARQVFDMLTSAGYFDCELRVFAAAAHPFGHAHFFARK